MKARVLVKLLVLGGLLVSAFNYCPPGAQAQPAASAMADCCRAKAAKNHCPGKSKDARNGRSCCTPDRVAAAQNHAKLVFASIAIPLYPVALEATAPQVVAHRLAHTLIRPAGPPGFSPAALGLRAPPLA